MFVEQVGAVIREVGAAEVVPRFRALATEDIMEKSPGDLVTIADQECERVLTERLTQVRDVPVVGEEAATADPSLLDVVAQAPACWIIDPIDGTSNFVEGNPNFAVIVAYVENGTTETAWIWHPETDSLLSAERGGGVHDNGHPLAAPTRTMPPQGILKSWRMGKAAHDYLHQLPAEMGQVLPALGCAAMEYSALVRGEIDFLLYWRTLPWDHAAGALLVAEAGLTVARPDGSPYEPGDGRSGIFSAVPETWNRIAPEIQAALLR